MTSARGGPSSPTHTDHDEQTTRHYLLLAARLQLAVTGGSDFHGDESHGGEP